MPKKRGKKNSKTNRNNVVVARPLLYKQEGQEEYAMVLKMLGDRRVRAYCYDGTERLCRIRGSMRKKVWIAPNDIVLVSLRDFTEDCADIIHKYNSDEVKKLKKKGELIDLGAASNKYNINDTEEEDENVVFEEVFEDI